MDARVMEIRTHPTQGQPGIRHTQIDVEAEGLHGDRRKKAAVHLVAASEAKDVRANLVLDVSADELVATALSQLQVGEAVLRVLGPAGNCGGVYAEVVTPGRIAVDDRVADHLQKLA